MADNNNRRWAAAKTALLIFLPILNAVQLYIIVTTNSDTVNELLRDYLQTKAGEDPLNDSHLEQDGYEEYSPLIPRPDESEEVKVENLTVKWSRSVDRLRYLAKHEREMYEKMKSYKLEIQSKLTQITSWIEDYEATSLKGTQHLDDPAKITEEIASHPFLAVAMLRRFSGLQEMVGRAVNEPELENQLKEMLHEAEQELPGKPDYEDAMWNIINLRYVYDLSITDLLNGKFKDIQTSIGLTNEYAYDIAVTAEKNYAYAEAFYWYDTVLEKVKNVEPDNRLIAQIEVDIDRMTVKHDELLDHITDDQYWDYPHRFTRKMMLTPKKKLTTIKQNILKRWHNGKDSEYSEYQYHEICAGHSYLTELEQARLTCFYDKKTHPYWLLRPLKVEVHSWSPYLIRIYDVISESMLEYLLASSKSSLEEAQVVNEEYNEESENSTESVPSRSRVGLYTFLQTNSTRLKYLYQRVSQMVGLKCEYSDFFQSKDNPGSAEDVQIANYAFGGHYEYHYDYLGDNHFSKVEGNRLATFMIYLNNVTSGGHTAFPKIGVSVKPIRNTAVFWFNLHRNGTGDLRTLHGGCPVILGHKWIANVWIHSLASFLERPCSLNPHE